MKVIALLLPSHTLNNDCKFSSEINDARVSVVKKSVRLLLTIVSVSTLVVRKAENFC